MPVPGLDAKRCRARNVKAARQGFNAVPVRLSAKAPAPIDTNDPAVNNGIRVITARGTLPATEAAALERINAMRGDDQDPLEASDVHLVHAEAGNSNFIRKYFMHLGDSSLRNIARRASKSIAFMNSHRTGGLSTETELPYGRTFAGRFEQAVTADGRDFSRTLLGVYMIRGLRPNGQNGPSTDDLYAGIKAGTIFDVSLGIVGGSEVCDVCGNELESYDGEGRPLCVHIPGTHRRMTTDEIDAQIARGVPDGVASFTLEDATAGEVSAVYDGAVPGAGFRKVLHAATRRELSAEDLDEARRSFAPLVGRRTFRFADDVERNPGPDRGRTTMNPKKTTQQTIGMGTLRQLLAQAGVAIEETDEPPAIPAQAAPPRPATATPTASTTDPAPAAPITSTRQADDSVEGRLRALEQTNQQLQAQLQSERQERQHETAEQRRRALLAEAGSWADQLVRTAAATPAERGGLVSLHAQAALDDAEHPAQVSYVDGQNVPQVGTRVKALEATWAKRGSHHFGREFAAPAHGVDPSTAGSPAPAPATDAPLVNLAGLPNQPSADPLGDAMVLAAQNFAKRHNGHATPTN